MEDLSVHAVFGLVGLIIVIGLGGELFFKKTGIPSGLFLIALGVVLGPVLGLVRLETIYRLAPYFGTLALLIILFDGGLNLPIRKVVRETPVALLFCLTVFLASMTMTAAFYVWTIGGSWHHGFLLGAIVGGTTPVIVMPIVNQLGVLREPARVMLTLESAFADVFIVVTALAVMSMMEEAPGSANMASNIFHAFVDAALLAVAAGVLWARLLAWMKGQPLSYMLTLAAILLLYDVAELLGGNGVMTILLFGLVLGNMENLVGWIAAPVRRLIGIRLNEAEFALDEFLRRLNEELSFLLRTFFYVLLGLILDVSRLSWVVGATSLGLFAVLVIVRWAVTAGFSLAGQAWTPAEQRIIVSMLPRGVAVAVMSFLPAAHGIPGSELFPLYALSIIVLSIIFMTLALGLERHRSSSLADAYSRSQPSQS